MAFWISAITCKGMVVSISLFWSQSLSSYNLQEGSIIQVIGYDRTEADKPTVGNSFETIEVGGQSAYDPYSTPEGHEILLETSASQAGVYETFTLVGDYDRIYIRFYQVTNLQAEEVYMSYWGLSPVRNLPGGQSTTWYVNYNNLQANSSDSFASGYFEVIPEPGTLQFLLAGGLLLLGRGLVRKKWQVRRLTNH